MVWLPNVLIWTERGQYSNANGLSSVSTPNVPVLQGEQAHMQAPQQLDYRLAPAGTFSSDFEIKLDFGADCVEGDILTQVVLMEDNSVLYASSAANSNETLSVQHAQDSTPRWLPHRRVVIRRATGGGPVY